MFKVGDKVACPPHGVGVIEGTEEREIGGKKVLYFRISLVGKNMSILIPKEALETSVIRPILSEEEIEEIFEEISISDDSQDECQEKEQEMEIGM